MKQYYAVIDTNVLISAMLKHNSLPGTIIKMALTGKIIPLLSQEILNEYQTVSSRPKFKFNQQKMTWLLQTIAAKGIFFSPDSIGKENFPDPKDVVFYEVLMEGSRQYDPTYLVTGNIRHFPSEPQIVTPREMLDIIELSEFENDLI